MCKKLLLFVYLFLFSFPYFATATSAVFIMYHRVGEWKYPSTNISIHAFESQMQYLKNNHYHVLPVPEIIQALQMKQPLPDKTIGILFDDAYDSTYTVAWPIMKRYHFPFTLFVATDPVDKGYADMMTWKEIRTLAEAGVTVGNHSASHGHLTYFNEGQVTNDIKRAQQRIFENTGVNATLFAYPYGEYNLKLKQKIKVLGFKAAFMQVSGATGYYSDFYAIPRFALNETYDDINRFAVITRTLPFKIKNIEEANPEIIENLPTIYVTILDKNISLEKLACYASDQGKTNLEMLTGQMIKIKPLFPLGKGRKRINCTLPINDRHYWYGMLLLNGK